MKTSQKTDDALRALVDLAAAPPGVPVRSSAIARRTGVPEKFLEAILVDLRKAGLVASRRGPEGGHRLARPAETITVAQVHAAIEGPLSLGRGSARRGRQDPAGRALADVWQELQGRIEQVLGSVTLAELHRRAEAGGRVIDFSI